jgi:uncharacterized protein
LIGYKKNSYLRSIFETWRPKRLKGLAPERGNGFHRHNFPMRPFWLTILLLSLSNVFMTFAWYAHLKELNQKPWIVAALVSWGIAFFEYMLQVPGNRIGYTVMSVGQLKILQEVITLTVFVPFALFYLKEPLKLDYLWAALCILGAVYFVFRSKWSGA